MSMLTLRIDDKRLETLSANFAQRARAMGIYTEDDVMRMCNEARAEDRAKARAEKAAKLAVA
jgi:hypothetical protein